MQKLKNAVRVIFALTAIVILSIIVGGIIGSELSYKVTSEYNYSPISFTQTKTIDSNFIEGSEYFIGGKEGSNLSVKQFIEIADTKLQLSEQTKHSDSINKYTFTGTLSDSKLKTTTQKRLDSFIESLKQDSTSERYKNLIVENINYTAPKTVELTTKNIDIAKVDVFMQNCNFYTSINLHYNVVSKDYFVSSTEEFLSTLCDKYSEPETSIEPTCNDCTYYPVDKKHPLSSDYSIEVINADGIPGGQKFSKMAYGNLLDLYTDAKAAGHNMRLTSAYRSYQDQQEVFEGWVQYEMEFGKSRAQAESDANSYSALPGFSEHQLGTTADISSLDCIGIETVCAANEKLWVWLRDNAYQYGFVMSYPPAKESLTGYIHEPWHYRYIGLELAKEYKDKYEGRSYLAEFLRNKKLY